ncbi:MAG: T9SS type A sorting domain-containing protein [Bacteroidales bacterium]|nr:T9SS type A sorting domain-containing protein [Bacteroidales bacterium]
MKRHYIFWVVFLVCLILSLIMQPVHAANKSNMFIFSMEETVAVNDTITIADTLDLCEGQSYIYHGQSISTGGSYTIIDNDTTYVLWVNSRVVSGYISGDTVFCAGDSRLLTASGGTTYQWDTGDTTSDITVSTPGNYMVTITDSYGCTTTVYTSVTMHVPSGTLSGDTIICEGDSIVLTASGAGSYLWNTGSNSNSITVKQPGTYTVTAYSSDLNCQKTLSLTAHGYTVPAMITASGATEFCMGDSVKLTASGGNHYLWNTGDTNATIVAKTAGNYQVMVTGNYSCARSETIDLVVHAFPTLTLTPDTNICPYNQITLSVSGATSYLWNTGDTTSTITVQTAGYYSVEGYFVPLCKSYDTLTVAHLPLPSLQITPNKTICAGDTTLLVAKDILSNQTVFKWSTGYSGDSLKVAPATDITYRVTATHPAGCQSSDSSRITRVVPHASFEGSHFVCDGYSIVLAASGADRYLWNTGDTTASIITDTAGNYIVTTYTSPLNCAVSFLHTVTHYPVPAASITAMGPLVFCDKDSVELHGVDGNECLWNTSENTRNIVAKTSGIYEFVAINRWAHPKGEVACFDTSSITIKVNPLPVITITGNTDVCLGASTYITAGGGTSYLWGDNLTTPTRVESPVTTTHYPLTVTSSAGCSSSTIVTLTVHPIPSAQIIGENSICQGDTAILIATGGNKYSWNTGDTTNMIKVASTGSYTVTVTGSGNCSATATHTLTVKPSPTPTISGQTSFCQGESRQLSANNGNAYLWSTGATTSSIMVNSGGIYQVTVTNSQGCSKTVSTTVTTHPIPQLHIEGERQFCQNNHTTLQAIAENCTYLWEHNGSTQSTVTVNSAGAYTVSASNTFGCVNTSTATVTVLPVPAPTISGTRNICAGAQTMLSVNGDDWEYEWNNGNVNSFIMVEDAGIYRVTVTAPNGCQGEASASVTVYPLPAITINGKTSICKGETTTLTATGGNTYLWAPGGNTQSYITLSPTSTTDYYLTVTNVNNCSNVKTITITVNPVPVASISGNDNLCPGGSLVLTAQGSTHYLWDTGDSTASLTVTTARDYEVTVSTGAGCSSTATHTVTARPAPAINISGQQNLCLGSNTTLTATGGSAGYTWNTGDNTPTLNISAGGNYTVTGSSEYGCTASASLQVTTIPLPQVSIQGDFFFCEGKSTNITAVGESGLDYLWNTNEQIPTISVNSGGTYHVTVTNNNNCSKVVSVEVMAYPVPALTIVGDRAVCPGQNAILEAQGASAYQWSTGATTAQVSLPVSSVPYSVTATNSYGCTATSSATITSKAAPTVNIVGQTTICTGDSTLFTASGATQLQWSTGHTSTSITAKNAGIYNVTATNGLGCSSTAEIVLTVNDRPSVTITGSSMLCAGDDIILSASGGNTYLWSNGNTTATISTSPNTTTTYSVTVTNAQQCSSVASKLVTVHPLPVASIVGNSTLCTGNTMTISAFGGTKYTWMNGDTNQSIVINQGGTYLVYVINEHNCIASTTKEIASTPTPLAQISGNFSFCEGKNTVLRCSGGDFYEWSNGNIGDSVVIAQAGNYTVTATNTYGCTATSSAAITSLSTPQVNITGKTHLCDGETTVLQAVAQGGETFLWNNGIQLPDNEITPGQNTLYTVTASNSSGCSDEASLWVYVHPIRETVLSDEVCFGKSYNKNGFSIPVQDSTGTYTFVRSLKTNFDCDSIITLNLNVKPLPILPNAIIGIAHISQPGQYTYTVNGAQHTNLYQWQISNPSWSIVDTNFTKSNILTVTSAGVGTLTVIGINNCGYSAPLTLFIEAPLSVTNIEMDKNIRVYPNPASSQLFITLSNMEKIKATITLYDLTGRVIKEVNTENETNMIDLSGYPSGTYMVRITNGNRVLGTTKVMKK